MQMQVVSTRGVSQNLRALLQASHGRSLGSSGSLRSTCDLYTSRCYLLYKRERSVLRIGLAR